MMSARAETAEWPNAGMKSKVLRSPGSRLSSWIRVAMGMDTCGSKILMAEI
jgi:hypothetical protein